MKNLFTLIILIISLSTGNLFSQINYTFSSSISTYAALTAPTVEFSGNTNEVISGNINIGFSFLLGCTSYTQVQICTEGWIGFGGGLASSSNNNLSGSTQRNIIAPLWDDIRNARNVGQIAYRLTGTAPNRVFTVEYLNMRWNDNGGDNNNGVITFQVKLFETSNTIEFNYRQESQAVNNGSASIGIAGPSIGEFYSVNTAGAVSTATETTNISTKPTNNRLYRFVPTTSICSGTPIAGSALASQTTTNCTNTLVDFIKSPVSASCGLTYQWQSSIDNITFTNIAGATLTSYSTNVTTTLYYRIRTTCTISGITVSSTSVLVTYNTAAPANDLPCNANGLVLGIPSSGNNSCSGNASEPAAGSCWSGGTVNTVWYSFVAPASGSVRMKTIIQASGTVLQQTQIALYGGACTSLTQLACNTDAPSCGGYVPNNSEITYSGLTPGLTYYISVDGENNTVGSFSILVISGTGSFPYVQGQDCPTSFTACNATTTIGNPGYQAIGGTCDHTGAGYCTNGEANSVWYVINIDPSLIGTQILTFDIVPNDYGNPNPITGNPNPGYVNPLDESDYDFLLWKVSGSGATNCAGINAGVPPVACNYSALGLSGCSTSGNSPAAYPGFNGSYEVGPTVSAGDSYVLVIQNWANSVSGFTLEFPPVSPVVYTPPTTVYWSGGAFNNDYVNTDNWGGCNAPTCGISAFVTTSSSNEPDLPAGTYAVNDLTINSGAKLTLRSGATLQICGNFTNDGSLICMPGSTIEFIGTGTQTVTGAFENDDAFFNMTVNKLLGAVVLASNIDVKGNFLTENNTSVLNTAGNRVRVGGNFANNSGNTTFSNTGTTGNLTFNGTGAQTYNQGSTQLDLNFVTMNKPSGVLTLGTNMFIKATTGNLTLTAGVITTNAFRVDVANSASTSVTAGNTTSYVNGDLWRTINSTGSYDFPVGTATLYERANVNFTAATTIPRLQARFDPWAGAPNTLNLPDCFGTATYNIPSQNMGIWTINASANPSSGTYDITLYSTGATNTAGAVGWTVEKAVNSVSPWGLNGVCAFSTVSIIRRTGLSGFSVFGVAQSTTPLPIELMQFEGNRIEQDNYLSWITASEINSDYFALERSRNGKDFETIGKITAHGNSTSPLHYSAIDLNQQNSINYYRLKLYDLDGSFDYSKIISISSAISSKLKIMSVYPNPGTEELFFNYSVSRLTGLNIQLVDNSGRMIFSTETEVEDNGVYKLNTSDYSDGFYLLQIKRDDGFQEVFRWIKK
jgi:hypothetical protein